MIAGFARHDGSKARVYEMRVYIESECTLVKEKGISSFRKRQLAKLDRRWLPLARLTRWSSVNGS